MEFGLYTDLGRKWDT